MNRIVLSGIVSLYAVTGTAQSLPVPFEADYEASKSVLSAKAKIKLSRMGEYYKYTMRSVVYFGFLKLGEAYECSVLHVIGNRLYPVKYVHQKEGEKLPKVQTRFDWTRKTITTTLGDGRERKIENVQYPAWDIFSIHLGLLMEVSSAHRTGQSEYSVVHKGRLTSHRASFEGIETVTTSGDSLQTVKVKVRGPKRANWFWFAKDFAWLPVRIDISDVVLQLVSPPGQAHREVGPPASGVPTC